MSITVPSPDKGSATSVPASFRPSGGLLPGVPAQPSPVEPPAAVPPRSRLVPAKVGPAGRAQVVHVDCPDWCVIDHMERVGSLDDLMHWSDFDIVQILTLTDDDTAHSELMVNVSQDPTASDPRLRTAHMTLNNSGNAMDAYLTPDMAEELADDLIAFAAQLRHKARQVRLYNQAQA
ncbi:DUF6907 domain-containing protein [Streptomyces sp. NPDC059165]|uniref:DUF6907 domain-containing protein n=1 Tax=Streptomyces sp. NPDC059165 TaxID=3346751 RepID=UPI00369E386F